jgi:hypothetical protein
VGLHRLADAQDLVHAVEQARHILFCVSMFVICGSCDSS